MTVNIVLFEPEIPQNTGNIARTCACTGARLHLVEPMGFRLSNKQLGRASMDYWDKIDLARWSCVAEFMEAHVHDDLHFFTSHAETAYTDAAYASDTYLIFGRESRGIDPDVLEAHGHRCVRIPMVGGMRSLNLANTAAIAVYEVMRRRSFEGMS